MVWPLGVKRDHKIRAAIEYTRELAFALGARKMDVAFEGDHLPPFKCTMVPKPGTSSRESVCGNVPLGSVHPTLVMSSTYFMYMENHLVRGDGDEYQQESYYGRTHLQVPKLGST